MIRKINNLLLLAEENDSGITLYRIFSQNGIVDIPVYIAETPLTCVAEGTGILLNNIHLIEK